MKVRWPQGIRSRLVALIILAAVPVFLVGVVIDVVLVLWEGRKERLFTLAERPTHIATEMAHAWAGIQSDVLFLTTIPPVDGLVRAWANNGLDPADGVSTESSWRSRMAQILTGLVETKRIYDQVRFLDHNGMEVVRVNFEGGKGIRVPDSQLQNKADRYYFTETAKLPKGQCYVSPVDLNQERGQIEVPHKPMVRAATPVFDETGQFRGVIVVNVLFERLVEAAVAGHLIPSAETFIADESGCYIYHSASPRKTWGGPQDLGTGEGVRKDYPADWRNLLNPQAATLRTPHGYLLATACQPWSETGRFLVVCAAVPESLVVAHDMQRRIAWVVLGSLGMLVLVLGAVVWPFGRSIVLPVSSLL